MGGHETDRTSLHTRFTARILVLKSQVQTDAFLSHMFWTMKDKEC